MNLLNFGHAADNGITIKASGRPVKETMDLLEKAARIHGATVYVRIDQQSEAQKNNLKIPPLEYLLFGNPAKGTALLVNYPLIALDLPLKIICWQDFDGKTLIGFNNYEYIFRRYGLVANPESPLNLSNFIDQVVKQSFQD